VGQDSLHSSPDSLEALQVRSSGLTPVKCAVLLINMKFTGKAQYTICWSYGAGGAGRGRREW